MAEWGWQRRFDEPITVHGGRELVTLGDAANYIICLPMKTLNLPDWQLAIEALGLVSKSGSTALARIAFLKALNQETHNWASDDDLSQVGRRRKFDA